jgi:hypothetical protein
MFEDQQDQVQQLLNTNPAFKELHDKHQELKQQVRDADLGVLPMDAYVLDRMKKEKLLLKDKMAQMLANA